MGRGRKKVILFFAGTAWLRSCRFLFHQFIQRDKSHKVIGNADVLLPFVVGLVRGFDIDRLDKLPQRIRGKLVQILILCTRWINCSKFLIYRSCTSISCCKV